MKLNNRRSFNNRRKGKTFRRFEHVTLNLNGAKATRQKLEGREHIVVPCVMITEGVHNGSRGPGFYPERETAPTVMAWNGMPIVKDHPESQEGDGITARDPEVLDGSHVGVVLNTRWERRKKRLTCQAWLDVKRTNAVDSRIIRNIESGKKVEVSTGLFLNRQKKKGTFKGERYTWVARDQRPDHLAILLDDKGACSVKKGCGLNTNSSKKKTCKCQKQSPTENRKMYSTKKKARLVRQLINNSGVWSAKDKKSLMDMPDSAFRKVYRSAVNDNDDNEVLKTKKKVVKNKGKERDEAETPEPRRKKKKVVKNSSDKKVSLKDLDPEILSVVNRGLKMEKKRKEALIEAITNSENNKFSDKWLGKQDLDVLEGIAAMAAPENEENEEDSMFVAGFRPNYGAAPGVNPVGNRRGRSRDEDDDEEEDGLEVPELFPVKNDSGDEDDDEEDDDDRGRSKKKSKKKAKAY